MRLKSVSRVMLSCFFVILTVAGCASTDESLKARLALLELKLDALEDQRNGTTALKVDTVAPQELSPTPAATNDAPADVASTIPGRATVVQPPVAEAPRPASTPNPANTPVNVANRPQPAGDGIVFLSQSAYADLSGARPVGVPSKNNAGMRAPAPKDSDSGKKTQDVKKREEKKPGASTVSGTSKKAPAHSAPQKKPDVAAYDAALKVILSGKTAQGRQQMTEFMQQYPGSPLEPNALYWVGETWYSDKSYDKAILVFKDITTKFPKHDKASAALYKLGACYEHLKDKGNAQFYWQALVEDFPKSEAAGLARKKLAAL